MVGAFLLGLGLGSLWGAALADRLSRRGAIAAFALCEIGIAVFAALSPTLFYDLLFGELIAFARRVDLVASLTFLALLPPTLLMGLSLPLLARAIAGPLETVATDIGLLYGINTLGAAVGAFLAGWLLIGSIGYAATIYVGAALNLLVALRIMLARRSMSPETAGIASGAKPSPLWQAHRQVWLWSGLALLSGFLVIALEIVWFRLLGVLMQSNAYAFSLVLAVFLFGDALGIVAGSFLAPRVRDLRRFFLSLQGGMTALALLAVLALYLAHFLLGGFIAFETGYYDTIPRLLAIMALTVLMVLPPAFLLGMSFPITQRAVQDDPALVGQRVGTIQLFNILGNAAGALVTGLLFLHWLGLSGTLRLIGLMSLALLLPLLMAGRRRRPELALAAAIAAMVLLLPSNHQLWGRLHGAREPENAIVAEDRTGVAVFREEKETRKGWWMYLGGHTHSRVPFRPLQGALGALGVLVHPDPRSILIIGHGGGATLYGASANPATERIRVVEIIGPVYDVTRELAERTGDPGLSRLLADPRIERHVGDGRHVLFTDESLYDVIEADALYPHSSRAGLLFSVEFFRQVRGRLNPGGIYVQWLASERTERTFRAVFPYIVRMGDLALVGSDQPITVDMAVLAARLRGPASTHFTAAGLNPERVLEALGRPEKTWLPSEDRPSRRLNTDLFPRDEYYLNRPIDDF